MDDRSIVDKAIEMKRKHGQIDVVQLAGSLGIDVYGAELNDDINSWIEYNKVDDKFSIVVNRNHSPTDNIFQLDMSWDIMFYTMMK